MERQPNSGWITVDADVDNYALGHWVGVLARRICSRKGAMYQRSAICSMETRNKKEEIRVSEQEYSFVN